LKGGIGTVILGRVSEEVLSAEGIELVIPLGFGGRGRHGDWWEVELKGLGMTRLGVLSSEQ
jgi:hypothetical protein